MRNSSKTEKSYNPGIEKEKSFFIKSCNSLTDTIEMYITRVLQQVGSPTPITPEEVGLRELLLKRAEPIDLALGLMHQTSHLKSSDWAKGHLLLTLEDAIRRLQEAEIGREDMVNNTLAQYINEIKKELGILDENLPKYVS